METILPWLSGVGVGGAALIAATNNNLFQGAKVCPSKEP